MKVILLSIQVLTSTPVTSRPTKKKKKESLLERVVESIEKETTDVEDDSFTDFGNYVAKTLRKQKPSQQVIARKIISDCLYYADLNALNITSQVVTQDLVISLPIDDDNDW